MYVAEGVAGNFTTLSVGGKRQVLAREPDADPETAQYPAGTSPVEGAWSMPAAHPAVDKRVVVGSPNRTEWLAMFGVSKSGGSMSAHYEYIDGGSASRFTVRARPGVVKRPSHLPTSMYIGFVWRVCMGAQGT